MVGSLNTKSWDIGDEASTADDSWAWALELAKNIERIELANKLQPILESFVNLVLFIDAPSTLSAGKTATTRAIIYLG